MATYTLDWSATNLGGSAVVSYGAGALLDFTDKPVGATAALSLTAHQGNSANVTIAEFSIQTSGSSVMTFHYHTSTESGWDKLHVDVDGVSQAEFSGATAWTSHAGINIASAGTHTIRFRYQKDSAGDIDQDRVWVALLNITNTVTTNDASGSVTTYDMELGTIPSPVTTSTWTNSTSEPISGTRSLRSPASTAANGSYDLSITQGASSGYTVVAFDWKVSSEFNYDELYIFPDASASNVPASGAPSVAGSPGWLDYNDTASGRFGIIVPPAGKTVLLRYAKDAGTDAGSDAAWIDNLSVPAGSGSPDGTVAAEPAVATGAALTPSFTGTANVAAVAPTASAEALVPAVAGNATGSRNVNAVVATASAAALAPAVAASSTIVATVATGTSQALAPAIAGGTVVSGGAAASASMQALAPVVTGSTSGSGNVAAVAATASLSALAPTITGSSVLAGGEPAALTMQALAPTVFGGSPNYNVNAPVMAVSAQVLIPAVEGIAPTYFFSPPSHEEPIRTTEKPLVYYRLTHARSVVRVNGSFTQIRTPMPEILQGLEEGVDYFRGGYEYEISRETALELEAAGYTTTQL